MNNEVKYILQGCLLVLLVIIISNIVQFFYHSNIVHTHYTKNQPTTIYDNKTVPSNMEGYSFAGSLGDKLFHANCASCHTIYKRLVGPALANIEERGPWSDRKQLYKWIHNPEKYMKTDAYTAGLFKEYNGVMMQAFPDLPEKDINAILDYIQAYSASPVTSLAVP